MQKRYWVFLMSGAMAAGLSACSNTSTERVDSDTRDSTYHREVTVERTERTASDTMAPVANSLTDSDVKGVRNMLGKVVNDALTKGDLDDVAGYLTTNDQNRIGKYADNAYPDLDGRIDQIRTAWKHKYGRDFDISADEAAFSAYRVVGDKAHANVTVPEFNRDWPAFDVKLVNEGRVMNSWRIDIPENVNGQGFKDRMLAELTKFGNASANWPDDLHDGYRAVAYHVFSALAGPADSK